MTSGRLYFCTSTGGFAEQIVPLDERSRDTAYSLPKRLARRSPGPSCRPRRTMGNVISAIIEWFAGHTRSAARHGRLKGTSNRFWRCEHCHDRSC